MNEASETQQLPAMTDNASVPITTKNLSPREKQAHVRSSFSRKVEIMEAIWKRGNPVIEWWPKTLEELRAWEEPDKGIYAWKSKGVDEPRGKHHDLRERYDRALYELKRILNSKSGVGMAAKISQLDAHVKALLEQNTVLAIANQQLTDDIQRLQTLLPNAK